MIRGWPALYHADNCLDICKKHKILDFVFAYCYEAPANAHAAANDKPKASRYLKERLVQR